ncbi:hypothetical protein MKK75_23000, partial [Methylobacterium sp. J-030]|uniref:hypothetical protein n=1 Tax=Methylobacterium sp. J-030 TaxID=2836627 RepID=UPI001FB86983
MPIGVSFVGLPFEVVAALSCTLGAVCVLGRRQQRLIVCAILYVRVPVHAVLHGDDAVNLVKAG